LLNKSFFTNFYFLRCNSRPPADPNSVSATQFAVVTEEGCIYTIDEDADHYNLVVVYEIKKKNIYLLI
jgi:hypothetical protein